MRTAMWSLKYLDLIVRTHRSFPSADVWLRYDRGFRRKAACSPILLDWDSTDLEVFHEAYASSNVLQPAAISSQSFRRSGELPRGGEAQGSPSAAEICRTWNSGHCTSGFAFCRCRHECSVCHGPHRSIPPPAAVSPIKFSVLASELSQHPSPAFRDYLLSGFEKGFPVGFQPSRVPRLQATTTNMQSALLNRDVVDQYLAQDVSLGRVASSFTSSPLASPLHTTRFQSVAVPGNGG